ncbi:MAG: hypothetical protein DDT37_01857 [Firmicutes bacterium]|nr:hypothetical protein [candidate division NPL-UPA2 bacterium]
MSTPIVHETIVLGGFKEMMKKIRKMEPVMRKEMRTRLKTAGRIVSDEAKVRAKQQGLYDTGKLVRSIRVGLRARSAVVVVGAKREGRKGGKYEKGYNYPKRYEYGQGRKRAFLRPALAAKREEAVRELAKILDETAKVWRD